MAIGSADPSEQSRGAPGGTLRIACAVGPAMSATWCVRGAGGDVEGVAADLGRAVAERAGLVPLVGDYPSSGAIVTAARQGEWDVAFIPADSERKSQVIFGPNFFLGESTFLVAAESGAAACTDVDDARLTVVGIDNTATMRSAVRVLRKARVVGVKAMAEAARMFDEGTADAIALGRESLASLMPSLQRPARILPDSFHAAGSALCTPPGRPDEAARLGKLLEAAKADGTVRRIFDRHGFTDLAVAPAGSHP